MTDKKSKVKIVGDTGFEHCDFYRVKVGDAIWSRNGHGKILIYKMGLPTQVSTKVSG